MSRWKRWSWLVTLPVLLLAAATIVSVVYLRREVLREVQQDAQWPLRVAQAEIDGWELRWTSRARATATLLAAAPLGDRFVSTVLSAAAVDGASAHVAPAPTASVEPPAETIATVRCGQMFCVRVTSPVRQPSRAVGNLVITIPITDRSFATLGVSGASVGSRVTILHRLGDSVFVLATAAQDSLALPVRAMPWSSLPPHIRDAFLARTRTGHADAGLVRARVMYASATYPDLGWLLLREVDGEELIERLLVPLGIQLVVVSSLLWFALAFVRTHRRETRLRSERALAELRGDFVAAVSHELRTPLAQITLFAELLRTDVMRGPEERSRALHVIEKEASRLSILVDNVLNHVRLRRDGRGRLASPVSATTVVGRDIRHVLEAFAPLAADRGVRVVAPDTETSVSAAVDSQALRQILLNLLENAVKYGPRGQTVTIAVRELGSEVCISVSDQGPGIPTTERDAIWGAFVRGSAARASHIGGSGIGLSVVRDLVQQHMGSVWVTDAEGGGARFEARFQH